MIQVRYKVLRGLARFEQRNKFSVGEEIEFMKPDGSNVFAKVEKMYNEKMEEIESCPHPSEVTYVKCSEVPAKYDLLRIAKRE